MKRSGPVLEHGVQKKNLKEVFHRRYVIFTEPKKYRNITKTLLLLVVVAVL